MPFEALQLQGRHIRLEPLDYRHVDGLAAASAADPSLYAWSPVPQGKVEAARYVETALAWYEAGTAVPFATVRVSDGMVIGCTRFFDLERWAWPAGHPLHDRGTPDACEIGYTWLGNPHPSQHRGQATYADACFRDVAGAASLFSY